MKEEFIASLAYNDMLKLSCINAAVSFEDRVTQRKEELVSLQNAPEILSSSRTSRPRSSWCVGHLGAPGGRRGARPEDHGALGAEVRRHEHQPDRAQREARAAQAADPLFAEDTCTTMLETKKQLGLSLLPSGNTPAAALPNAAAGAPHHARLD